MESTPSSSYDRMILLHLFLHINQKYLLIFVNEILSSSVNRPKRIFLKEFLFLMCIKTASNQDISCR